MRFYAAPILAAAACAKQTPPAPASTTAPPDFVVTVDGRPTWPPQGEGCDELVACCDAISAVESSARLLCQLAPATGDPCPTLQAKMVEYFVEKTGQSAPAVCAGG